MKRLYITLLSIMLFTCSFARITGNEVSMISYEQGWLDSRGTLALKNNTTEDIHNVTFQITYLDMSGNALDYKEFYEEVEIAPGLTRKLDIPAYEHSRSYHYYKSENRPGGSPAFKISFELKDFNTVEPIEEVSEIESDYSLPSYNDSPKSDDGPSGAMILLFLAMILIFIGIAVGMYVLVAVLAQRRKRNVVIWLLLSLLATPLLMVIILLVIGDAEKDGHSVYEK